ncbi:hypothetical protein FRC04_002946 [Tulasnella sp. 424]|nr:hypothetical protein FRC04_002946 [Tulasnella sp. 424]
MKASFSSVFVLAVLFHLPCLVLGAPFAWNNRHYHIARSELAANSTTAAASKATTTTTTLAKAKETTTTAFVNSTTTTDEKAKATATKTQAESTASATIIKGQSPLQTALTPQITDWNSCQSFLSNSGINLFVNQVNLNFDVVINEVTVIQILIDNNGRARETRVGHAFPQPTNYYPQFDKSKNKSGNNKNNGSNKGKPSAAKSTVTATATQVTTTAGKAENTSITTTTTAGKAKDTASTTTTTTSASAETTSAASAASSTETASA